MSTVHADYCIRVELSEPQPAWSEVFITLTLYLTLALREMNTSSIGDNFRSNWGLLGVRCSHNVRDRSI